MTDVLLISEAKVRQFTDINNSVDTDLITNNIRVSQDYYLQAVIGTKLYEKLMSDVQNNTLTGYYLTLVNDYIQDFLLYCTYYETLESIYLRPRNNGLLKPTGGENSEGVDKDLYNMKRQSIHNKMTYYNERLTNYIIEEEGNFPEIGANAKLYEQIADFSNKYKNPFVVRKYQNLAWAEKYGIPTYNSRYKYLPQ